MPTCSRWKPGITGMAALEYLDEESLLKGEDWEEAYRERIMPAKLKLKWSTWTGDPCGPT